MRTKNAKILLSALNLGAAVAQLNKRAENFVRIQSAIVHLRLLRMVRASYVNIFQIIFFCMFFLMGLVFLHAGAILLLTSGASRFSVGLLIAGILETGAPVLFALWFTSPDRMLQKAAKHNPVLKEYIKRHSAFDED